LTGRDSHKIKTIEGYAKENKLWRTDKSDAVYSGAVMELDLGSVQPCISGPKRPHDRVSVSE